MVGRTFLALSAVLAGSVHALTITPPPTAPPTTTPLPPGTQYEIQNGFDFVDHDIAQVPGTFDSCFPACRGANKCTAWSWSNWNNGTCFLKSAVDKIVVNPDVKSARVWPTYPLNGCREVSNVDYEDANIASVKAAAAHDCCDLCKKQAGCRYYSWNNYEGGTCWLKATGDKKVAKLNVYSAPAYSDSTYTPPVTPTMPPGSQCEDQNGFDFIGHDLTHVNGSVDTCCASCVLTPKCKAWTWSNHQGGTCWLKDGVDQIVSKPDVRSSRVWPVYPLNGCKELSNYDYEDPNIASVKAAAAHDCCDICKNYQGCRYYAWNNFEGGTCWLKATGNKKVAKLNVYSAPAYSDDIYTTPAPTTPVVGSQCEVQNGFDFVDHDLTHVNGTVDTCCDACRATRNCQAWTWSNHQGGTCWLKNGVDKIVANPEVRSARVFAVVPLDGCKELANVDYEDANIASVKAPQAHDCCDICKNYQGCRYYAWNKYENGTCWLKATGDKQVNKTDVWAAPAYSTHSLI